MEKNQTEVADYYNRNTPHFLKSKKSRLAGAIHRQLYPPGIEKKSEAESYSNLLILEIIKKQNAERILDLGCGVGGTIRYLKERYPADYWGITISEVQRDLSNHLGTEIEVADFQDTRWFKKQEPFDLIFALESLQHNPDHEILSNNLAKICIPGSKVVIIDDFLFQEESGHGRPSKLVKRFKKHWHAQGYTSVENFLATFEKNGFILKEKQNLSGYMKKTPLLNLLLGFFSHLLLRLPLKSPARDNIIGGNALKKLQDRGYSGYFKLVLEYTKN